MDEQETSLLSLERCRLHTLLEELSVAEWATPALFPGHTVRSTVAHLVYIGDVPPPRYLYGMRASDLTSVRAANRAVREVAMSSPEDLLERHGRQVSLPERHIGLTGSWLAEVVVHGLDISVPLDRTLDHDQQSLIVAAEYCKEGGAIRRTTWRKTPLRLSAEDVPWSVGTGPEVTGPLWALLLALAGRRPALTRLHGAGLDALADRLVEDAHF